MYNNAYKYLSDAITVSFKLDDKYKDTNLKYMVYQLPDKNTPIYVGQVYITGDEQTLYLNDIIETVTDDYSWFKTRKQSVASGVIMDFEIMFENNAAYFEVKNVINSYRVPNSEYEETSRVTTGSRQIVPMIEFNNCIYPRIPWKYNIVENQALFATNIIRKSINIDKYGIAAYVVRNGNDNLEYHNTLKIFNSTSTSSGVEQPILTDFSAISNGVSNDDFKMCQLGVGILDENGNYDTSQEFIKICDVDLCPAEYYLCWINRYGVFQCQPFH
jgi:hypothetical protein